MERRMRIGKQIGVKGLGVSVVAKVAYEDAEARELVKGLGLQYLGSEKAWRGFAYQAAPLAGLVKRLLVAGFQVHTAGTLISSNAADTVRFLHQMGIDPHTIAIYDQGAEIDPEYKRDLIEQYC